MQEDETTERSERERHFETPRVREQRPQTPAPPVPVPSEADAADGDQRPRPEEPDLTADRDPGPGARRYTIAIRRTGATVRLGTAVGQLSLSRSPFSRGRRPERAAEDRTVS